MKKNSIFYVAYLLVMACFIAIGSLFFSTYRDNFFAGGFSENSYLFLYAVSLLFPFMIGVLFAAEHLYTVYKSKKAVTYNWKRFWCISLPLVLILIYSNLSYWGSSIGIHLPLFPDFGMKDLQSIVSFGFGYSLITNISGIDCE